MYLSLSPSTSSLSNFLFIKLLTHSHILAYFFNSLLSITLKDIVLLLSKHLAYPNILSEFFLPYDSFLETNILLTSQSYMFNSFLFFVEITLVDFFIIKIYAISNHPYT